MQQACDEGDSFNMGVWVYSIMILQHMIFIWHVNIQHNTTLFRPLHCRGPIVLGNLLRFIVDKSLFLHVVYNVPRMELSFIVPASTLCSACIGTVIGPDNVALLGNPTAPKMDFYQQN